MKNKSKITIHKYRYIYIYIERERERDNWCLINREENAGGGNGSKEEKKESESQGGGGGGGGSSHESARPPMPQMGIVVFLIFQYSDPTLPQRRSRSQPLHFCQFFFFFCINAKFVPSKSLVSLSLSLSLNLVQSLETRDTGISI